MKKASNIITIIALILILVLIGGVSYGYYKKATMEVKNPIVTMEIQDYGTIKIELYPDKAPNTVANFIRLANRGYYNGTKFHRIVKDFMIQTGSKGGDGTTDAKLSDLKEKSLILPIPGTANRNDLDELFINNNIDIENVVNIHTSEMIISAVKKDLGIGYIIYNLVEDDIKNGELELLNIKEVLPTVEINIIFDKNFLTTAPKKFIENYIDYELEL